MAFLHSFLQIVQIIAALAVIGLVLIQHGKGADAGAAFGGGSSNAVFGAAGSANFLSRSTAIAAVVFFLSTLGLAFFTNAKSPASGSVMKDAPAVEAPKDAPATSSAPVVPKQ